MSKANNNRPGISCGWQTATCSHIFRILHSNRVPWILIENVPGLLQWHRGDGTATQQPPGIAWICKQLEELRYSWAHRLVDLPGFGIPHRRKRVFIVASLHGDPRDILLSTESECKGQCIDMFKKECYECFCTPPHNLSKLVCAIDTGESRCGPSIDIIPSLTSSNCGNIRIIEEDSDKVVDLAINDAERLFGFPVGWTNPIGESIPMHVRFRLLGQCVAVPQSKWIGDRFARPHDLKFLRGNQGKAFTYPVLGEGADSSWPKVAWNILNVDSDFENSWTSREYLDDMNEIPLIQPYIPISEFLFFSTESTDKGILSSYKNRIPAEFLEGFAEEVIDKYIGLKKSSRKRGNRYDDAKVVWVKTKIGQNTCHWPCLLFHKTSGEIPEEARDSLRNLDLPNDVLYVEYLNLDTFDWKNASDVCDFKSNLRYEKQMISNVKWKRAIQLAKDIVGIKDDMAINESDSTCGACEVCIKTAQRTKKDKYSFRIKLRKRAADPPALHECMKLSILRMAKNGHHGAVVALMREKAIGHRLKIFWSSDCTFYKATITDFDPLKHTFTLVHDDGHIETAVQLWKETITESKTI